MMPEFTAVNLQTVAAGQNVLLTETPVGCGKGYVTHREGSGIVTLRGITNQCRIVSFHSSMLAQAVASGRWA